MFRRQPITLQELKHNITGQIGAIWIELLQNAVYNLEEKLVILQEQNEDPIEQLVQLALDILNPIS